MRILAIGDITDPQSLEYIAERLWDIRAREKIDFVIVNAENASFITGASAEQLGRLIDAGADVVTGGNHTLQNKSAHAFLDDSDRALRPVNYPPTAPGSGYTVVDCNGYRALVINALGRVNMEPRLDCPFTAVNKVLAREEGNFDFAILDFHADAVGEKLVMPHYFDGKISIIFGTHTHVQTADEQIFPKGTAYISDIGMCGHRGGIIGSSAECIIERTVDCMPARYEPADGEISADGVIFTLDSSFRATEIKRVKF